MVDISENSEALVILCESIFAAASGSIASLPIPLEIKAPIVTLTTSIAGAIFVYWKAKININKK